MRRNAVRVAGLLTAVATLVTGASLQAQMMVSPRAGTPSMQFGSVGFQNAGTPSSTFGTRQYQPQMGYQSQMGYQQRMAYQPQVGYQSQMAYQPQMSYQQMTYPSQMGYQQQMGYPSQMAYQPQVAYQQQMTYPSQMGYQPQTSFYPQSFSYQPGNVLNNVATPTWSGYQQAAWSGPMQASLQGVPQTFSSTPATWSFPAGSTSPLGYSGWGNSATQFSSPYSGTSSGFGFTSPAYGTTTTLPQGTLLSGNSSWQQAGLASGSLGQATSPRTSFYYPPTTVQPRGALMPNTGNPALPRGLTYPGTGVR